MSDVAIFTLVFGGLLVLRIIAATLIFVLILPRGDRCPLCDTVTIRVRSRLLGSRLLRLSKRWCLTCGWEGYMRLLPPSSIPTATDHLSSKPTAQPSRRP